ncbi:MAG TPA: helix-turn-helix domain-containing protein [Gemmataceae bacterium]|jgi:excisionase family DNA binding protein|nr:helix-turn-helix domain-containing protein [Gemmataceae bacterium]
MIADKKPLTVAQVAEHFGVCEDTIYAALRARKLIGARIGRVWRIERADMDKWFASLKPEPPVKPRQKPNMTGIPKYVR